MAAEAGTGPAWARSAVPPDPARRMAIRTVAPRTVAPRAAGPRTVGFQTARRAADPRTATAAAGSWCPFPTRRGRPRSLAGDAPKAVTVHGNAFADIPQDGACHLVSL